MAKYSDELDRAADVEELDGAADVEELDGAADVEELDGAADVEELDGAADVDGVFVALADRTRRDVIRHLGRGPKSVGDLAREFPMTLPSFMKHVRVLEANGLIHTVKSGRVRTCVLKRDRLAVLDDWLAGQRRLWEERTDRLESFVTQSEEEE